MNRTVTLIPLTRPKNRVQVQLGPKADPTDEWKDRAAWLLEALGATWSHRHGYTLAPSKAAAFVRLYGAGWRSETGIHWRGEKRPIALFSQPGDETKYTLKAALSKLSS